MLSQTFSYVACRVIQSFPLTQKQLLSIPIPLLWVLNKPLHMYVLLVTIPQERHVADSCRRIGIFILLASGMFVLAAWYAQSPPNY
jgi:hypothetical protein